MKTISKDKTYVLRDGEEYDVSILRYPDQEGYGSVQAKVQCLNTLRTDTLLYTHDGYHNPNRTPSAVDLIDRMEWYSDQPLGCPALLQKEVIYRTQVDSGLHFTLHKFGDHLTDEVEMSIGREATGQFLGRARYHCDGATGNAALDPFFSLVPAFPLCSTWRPGDPLIVTAHKPHWARAIFVRMEEGNIVTSTSGVLGNWLANPLAEGLRRYSPSQVRIPTADDARTYTEGWNDQQMFELFHTFARMRKSWPKGSAKSRVS